MVDPLPENLSPATIHQIAWDIRDGTASPDDAKRLMLLFCECFDNKKQPPIELAQHFYDAFRAILAKEKTAERALGLARRKSRPKADTETRTYMALEVLRMRLRGFSHQDAIHEVADKFGWGVTIIGEGWREYKQDALVIERVSRSLDSYPWSDEEVRCLSRIFKNESWFIAPGKSRNKPA